MIDLLPYNTTWLRRTKIAMPEELKEQLPGHTVRIGWNELTEAIYVCIIQQKPVKHTYIGSVHVEREGKRYWNEKKHYRNTLNKEARKLARDKKRLTEIIQQYTETKTHVGEMTYTNYFRRECR